MTEPPTTKPSAWRISARNLDGTMVRSKLFDVRSQVEACEKSWRETLFAGEDVEFSVQALYTSPPAPIDALRTRELLAEILASFSATQDISRYPPEHWSHRAEMLLAMLSGKD